LLEQFQHEYQQSARANFEANRQLGRVNTFWDVVRRQPVLTLLVISFCLFIIYVSTQPFLNLIQ
jgi:hypothetical protein